MTENFQKFKYKKIKKSWEVKGYTQRIYLKLISSKNKLFKIGINKLTKIKMSF
jgi:hypothetical protein